MIKIYKEDICNLSRIPCSIYDNPCYKTILQILENKQLCLQDSALYELAETFKPKTLADLYNVSGALENYKYDRVFLPWIHKEPAPASYRDVAFVSYENKSILKKQFEKIKKLILSIKEKGFIPDKFPDRKKGQITGYFLKNGNKVKFYVVSGNHRTSVVSALSPHDLIPSIYEENSFMKPRDKINVGKSILNSFPNCFDAKEVDDWPSVKSGFLKREAALQIINKYLGV